jgi:hypothetical protein
MQLSEVVVAYLHILRKMGMQIVINDFAVFLAQSDQQGASHHTPMSRNPHF